VIHNTTLLLTQKEFDSSATSKVTASRLPVRHRMRHPQQQYHL
jgi:hypothetical protein